jgi:hypothetical protein
MAKKFITLGAEVHITRSSYKAKDGGKLAYDNREVFAMASRLKIPKENITFTAYEDKYSFVKDFDFHFDDDDYEINLINEHPSKCIGCLQQNK